VKALSVHETAIIRSPQRWCAAILFFLRIADAAPNSESPHDNLGGLPSCSMRILRFSYTLPAYMKYLCILLCVCPNLESRAFNPPSLRPEKVQMFSYWQSNRVTLPVEFLHNQLKSNLDTQPERPPKDALVILSQSAMWAPLLLSLRGPQLSNKTHQNNLPPQELKLTAADIHSKLSIQKRYKMRSVFFFFLSSLHSSQKKGGGNKKP
jgi:hypothetical protein